MTIVELAVAFIAGVIGVVWNQRIAWGMVGIGALLALVLHV